MRLYNDIIISGNKAVAKSYAKINLTLDVLSRRENGYHDVCMVMQTINLYDTVTVVKKNEGIALSISNDELPTDGRNIAYKAAEIFFNECGINGGAEINIDKNIPIAAGLAGGSSNAAAVICALNLLYETNLDDDQLIRIGTKLGADVPFCIIGGTCLCKGIGEEITEIDNDIVADLLIVKPEQGISTAEIYKEIDNHTNLKHHDTKAMIDAVKNGNINEVSALLSNVMESVTINRLPEINKIKQTMSENGAIGTLMSGSGPTVYGIFENKNIALTAGKAFADKYSDIYITRTYN